MKENIIQRNLFRLLRAGAFGDKTAIEPMSPFKWRRLYQMVETQHVEDYFVDGVNSLKHDDGCDLPHDLIERIAAYMHAHPSRGTALGQQPLPQVDFSSRWLRRKYHNIIEAERHSIDTSVETLHLLRLVVFNQHAMLNTGMSMDGIIRLGQFLRHKGQNVDFVKLDNWLSALRLQPIAQLQGCVLIDVFGFEQDEVPFVRQADPNAQKLALIAVSQLAHDAAKEWHVRQTRSDFVSSNTTILRRNMRRSLRYIEYATMETTSTFFTNFIRSMAEIEE